MSSKQQKSGNTIRCTFDVQHTLVRVEVVAVIDNEVIASRSANTVSDLRDIFGDFSHLVVVAPEYVEQQVKRFEGMKRDARQHDPNNGVAFHKGLVAATSVGSSDDWKSQSQRNEQPRASALATVEIPQNPTMSDILRVAALQSRFSFADRQARNRVFLVNYSFSTGKYMLGERTYAAACREWSGFQHLPHMNTIPLGIVRDGVILAQLKHDPLVERKGV